jgi:hypothetical protein
MANDLLQSSIPAVHASCPIPEKQPALNMLINKDLPKNEHLARPLQSYSVNHAAEAFRPTRTHRDQRG